LLGAFYTSLFGGLFFVFLPMEAVYIRYLKSGFSPFLIILVYVGGFLFSYTANYYIGLKLNNVSKKIISPKKFYKIKGIINRYGAWAIFGFNVLPLPSQPLSTILGVFRYNKKRFYLFFLLGQLIKYTAITVAYIYIF
jgi:membrane protein YqaA with SNARE-associated domain